ncbi:MAG: hypothetical protein R2716_02095 [Microthrixaceae bacterium]
MGTRTVIPGSRSRVSRRWAVAALLATVSMLALAGCATNPPYIVSVPGTYTIDFSAPTVEYPQGSAPVATVVMCVEEPTAVGLTSGVPLEEATLEWSGSTFTFPTPVLQPGCGNLRLVVPCCFVPPTVQITLTEL